MFLEGLARTLEQEPDLRVVGQYPFDESALQVVNKSGATIILIGINGETERAVDFVRKAHGRGFDGKILVVTSRVSGPEGVHLVQAGVAGILKKSNSIESLCNTIRQITRGEVCVEKTVLTSLLRSMNEKPLRSWPKLSDRERSILRLLCDGLANRQIAHQLEVSEGSVKASIQQLFAKLAVRTRSQLVRVALEQ
jgi:DNA-binding NarL/FixJ family response regulator